MCLSKTLGLFTNFAQTQRHWMFLFSILQSIGSELGGGSPRQELLCLANGEALDLVLITLSMAGLTWTQPNRQFQGMSYI